MTSQEFFEFVTSNSQRFRTGNKMLGEKFGLEFTRFSLTEELLNMVLNDEMTTEIVAIIKKANETETDIVLLLAKNEHKKGREKQLDNFIEFIKKDNNYRLFIFVGEVGVGKTTTAITNFPNAPVIACNAALDPYSLCYELDNPDGEGLRAFETPFLRSLKAGGIIIMDELNSLPYESLMFIQGITDKKDKIMIGREEVKINNGFKIIATMNPNADTDERRALGDALLSRAIGYVMELNDNIIMERLGVSQAWINNIRSFYMFLVKADFEDVRALDYRDFEKIKINSLENVMKFKFCVNSKRNISIFNMLAETQEFHNLLGLNNNGL